MDDNWLWCWLIDNMWGWCWLIDNMWGTVVVDMMISVVDCITWFWG
jgi:hypothetical protein